MPFIKKYPLYDYAARNWAHHARVASTEVGQLILGFLESEAKMSGSSQVFMASRGSSGYSQDVLRQITGVPILAAIFVEWRTKDAWKRICWLCHSDCVVGARTTYVRHEEHVVASLVRSTYNAIIS